MLMWWGVVCCVCVSVCACVTLCVLSKLCAASCPSVPFPTVSLQFGLKTSDVLLFDRVFRWVVNVVGWPTVHVLLTAGCLTLTHHVSPTVMNRFLPPVFACGSIMD